jgi:hypothetical protein
MPPPEPDLEFAATRPARGTSLDGPRRGQRSVLAAGQVVKQVGILNRTISVEVVVKQEGHSSQPIGAKRIGNGSSWEALIELGAPGPAEIMFECHADAMGGGGPQFAEDSVQVTVLDNPPLVLTVVSPVPGDMPMPETGRDVALIAQVTESEFVHWVEASLDSWATVQSLAKDLGDPAQSRWMGLISLPKDAPRDHTAAFRCFDFFGRQTSQTVAFRAVDFTPPWIEVSTPPATGGEPFVFPIARQDLPWQHEVIGRVGDTQSGLAEVKWFMSGLQNLQDVVPDAAGEFRFPIERGDYGLYTLLLWATDRQGNVAALNRQFRIAEAG